MAAATLVGNQPQTVTLSSTVGQRRRVVMPSGGGFRFIRVYSASDLYIEHIDAADESTIGDYLETIPGGIETVRYIGRGEIALSPSSAGQEVELTAVQQ